MTTRGKLGLLTLVLLIAALALSLAGSTDQAPAGAACFRVAIVLGAWWMAYPQLASLPRWLVVVTGMVAVIAAFKPKALLIGLPLVLALWMLRPRHKRPTR